MSCAMIVLFLVGGVSCIASVPLAVLAIITYREPVTPGEWRRLALAAALALAVGMPCVGIVAEGGP